jgi:predicted PurR-regulated permease PerM
MKKIFGVVLMIFGVVSIVVSLVIKSRIHEGKIQISSAQEMVDTGNSQLSKIPFANEIGKGITRSAQNEINAGSQKIYNYTLASNFMLYGGIALIILGTLLIFIPASPKKN